MIRNLIFDIDGTLLDSRQDIAGAQIWTLRQLGVTNVTPEQVFPLIGRPLKEIFERLLPPSLHPRIPEGAILYRDYYRAHALDTTKLSPGVAETLEDLTTRGIRCAVATTKSTETSKRVLEHFGIARFFRHIQGNEEGMPFKPDPAIIVKILETLQWKAVETGMVGDSDYDILAGQRAGVKTCAVTYGACPRAVFLPLKPDRIIDEISELRVFC